MLVSSLFGGGYLSDYIDSGATYKNITSTGVGVLLDVQERGFFVISTNNVSNCQAEITIDGKVFSYLDLRSGLLSMLNVIDGSNSFYSVPIGYRKSLKVEVISNPNPTQVNIHRTSL